jgi:hypothetical protein
MGFAMALKFAKARTIEIPNVARTAIHAPSGESVNSGCPNLR